jgi:hypothetical protein
MILIEVCNRLDENVASRHPWKQLLGTASGDTRDSVLRTLETYVQIWYPPDHSKFPDGRESLLDNDKGVVELFKAVEQDLEKGLSFIREVEKGSHMKVDAVLRFRPQAIEALCELCRGKIEDLRPKACQDGHQKTEDDEAEDGEEEEEEGEGEANKGRGRTASMVPNGRHAQDSEAAIGLIGTVYRDAEPQFKTRLQLLVHQHKTKARSK